jgi:hypothetical protein
LHGRSAHDGYSNPTGKHWDSDWLFERSPEGWITGMSFKRRYCMDCKVPIQRDDAGMFVCPECGRIFSIDKDGGWPYYAKYIGRDSNGK